MVVNIPVGAIDAKIVSALSLSFPAGTSIFLGDTNTTHMRSRHPVDYAKYGADIPYIIAHPDFVGLNPSDGSIEYVKEYIVNKEFVKVAVRVSGSGILFVRSLYVLNSRRVKNFISAGTLKAI